VIPELKLATVNFMKKVLYNSLNAEIFVVQKSIVSFGLDALSQDQATIQVSIPAWVRCLRKR